MAKLICHVKNCSHNKEAHCTLSYIEVDGPTATNTVETRCAHFTADAYTANNQSHVINEEVAIACQVGMCLHNMDEKCQAKEVEISGPATTTSSVDTQCVSFWSR